MIIFSSCLWPCSACLQTMNILLRSAIPGPPCETRNSVVPSFLEMRRAKTAISGDVESFVQCHQLDLCHGAHFELIQFLLQ